MWTHRLYYSLHGHVTLTPTWNQFHSHHDIIYQKKTMNIFRSRFDICNFSLNITSKWPGHSPEYQKLTQRYGHVCFWRDMHWWIVSQELWLVVERLNMRRSPVTSRLFFSCYVHKNNCEKPSNANTWHVKINFLASCQVSVLDDDRVFPMAV